MLGSFEFSCKAQSIQFVNVKRKFFFFFFTYHQGPFLGNIFTEIHISSDFESSFSIVDEHWSALDAEGKVPDRFRFLSICQEQ